jgi:UDP-N-acetylmuramoylalanine--D-glutamate ligase
MTQLELVDGVLRGEAFVASLKGARATVIGLARHASAAARLLNAVGARVRLEPVGTTAALAGEDLIVVTAAAALASPAVATARAAGALVLGDLDLGWCATEADTIVVAGSGGVRAAMRFASTVLGRQGRPLLVAGGAEEDLLVSAPGFDGGGLVLLEASALQLATAQIFRPRVAVLMSAAPGGLGALPDPDGAAATPDILRRVLIHQTPRDCVILDADEPGTCELTRDARARVLWCRTTGALDHGVYVAKNRIAARLNGHVEEICPIGELPRGVLRAALVAVACALWVGMSPEAIASVLAPGKSGTAPFLAARGRLRSVTTAERAGEARAPASSTVTA